jgi:5'-nucleotidase/UDP-sugar diphosphatase
VPHRRITILHSNDMHGDFLAEPDPVTAGIDVGGLALLSGYLRKVREEEDHVLYMIAGDMVQGSIIDLAYRGVSTVEIMNFLSPDVVTLGNHEFDYGLQQLLWLEKLAAFPIVNANLYVRRPYRRLMRPFEILDREGFKVLVIGLITDQVIDAIKNDSEVGTFISLEAARDEVGRVCNAHRDEDIPLTVLLTHIGLESDIELAKLLDPAWGVDMIIGGHSHSTMDRPVEVNGVVIAHTGGTTNHIGRFDLVVDEETNAIREWTWRCVPLDSRTCTPDPQLDEFIEGYRADCDSRYNRVLAHFATELTHPQRTIETALGNLTADAIAGRAKADVVFYGSGSIRSGRLGPAVTLGNFLACYPYDDIMQRFTIAGAALRRAFAHWMRPENRNGEGECYQVSAGVEAVYDESRKSLVALNVRGTAVDDAATYTLALPNYHVQSADAFLGLSNADLTARGEPVTVATSINDILQGFFETHQNVQRKVEGRLRYVSA